MATQFPVRKRLILDPIGPAWQVENTFARYLKPRLLGLWLPNRTTPTMVPGGLYFRSDKGQLEAVADFTAQALRALKGDILNLDGEVVLPAAIRLLLKDEPTLPVRGLEIVHGFVDKVLTGLSRQWCRRAPPDLTVLWQEQLQAEAFHSHEELLDVVDAINSMLGHLSHQIVEFVGYSEDDKWVMHFQKTVGTDIHIERSIDFRVYDWSRRTNKGEWL